MKAMLLAAGFGTRMLPLTRQIPKAAIPVLGRPIAVQILQRLAELGVEDAVVNLHHMPETLERLLGAGPETALPRIHFSHEETILGTAGGLRKAGDLLRGEGPILVHNSDFLSDIDVARALDAHRVSGNLATLVLTTAQPGYSGVDVDADGQVLALAGLPEADPSRIAARHLFTGCHIIEEELLDRIPGQGPSHIVNDVYHGLAEEGRLGSYFHDGFWWEYGSPEKYLEGSLRLMALSTEERLAIAKHDPIRPIGSGTAAVGPGADVGNDATVNGAAALGFACHVGESAQLEDSIVMPEAWVGPRSRLRRAVIAPGVELTADFEIEDALVCEDRGRDTELPPATRRVGGLLIRSLGTQPV